MQRNDRRGRRGRDVSGARPSRTITSFMGRGRGSQSRAARGATLVEYALGVAFIVLACAAAAAALDTGARGEVNNQANCVETRPPPVSCQRPALTTTTTSGNPSTTSTTVPPTVPPAADSTATSFSSVFNPAPFWQGTVNYSVISQGSPVDGAIVRVRATVNPSGSVFFVNCTTGASGQCAAVFDTPFSDTQTVIFTVTDVEVPPGFATGTLPGPTTVSRPL